MFCARIRPGLDPPDAVLWVRRYVFEYVGFPDAVGYHEDYGEGNDF